VKDFEAKLVAAGMSSPEAHAKMKLFAQCNVALGSSLPRKRESLSHPLAFFVPGRIEVLGKHTDYAGGRSLLCAVERGFAVLATPRDDAIIRAVAVQRDETRTVSLDSTVQPEAGDWATYVSTVVRRVARDFPAARRGMDVAFASDLPAASGMSSSSALVIAIFLALREVNHLEDDPVYRRAITSMESLAEYLGALENGRPFGAMEGGLGVGTLGGSQDQTAILCCKAGTLSRYSFCPVRAEGDFPSPPNHSFVLAYSGVAAEKTASARLRYNEASLAVSEIVDVWNATTTRTDRCLGDAVTSSPDAAASIRALLEQRDSPAFSRQRLLDRFDQFLAEAYDIIPKAAEAFALSDLAGISAQVARSQEGVERLLGNQVPETIALVRIARELGAVAASAFGAGFGGSVWAFIASAHAEAFTAKWRTAYAESFPDHAAHAEFMVTLPGPGAVRL
jgi:galactokinase